MMSTTWLRLPCGCRREAISSWSWVKIDLAAAAALSMQTAYRTIARMGMSADANGPARTNSARDQRRRKRALSGVQFFLDAQLLFFERLEDRVIGYGPGHLFANALFEPLVLGLQCGGVR